MPANGGGTPPQVPLDALASDVVDSTVAEPVPAGLGSAWTAAGRHRDGGTSASTESGPEASVSDSSWDKGVSGESGGSGDKAE